MTFSPEPLDWCSVDRRRCCCCVSSICQSTRLRIGIKNTRKETHGYTRSPMTTGIREKCEKIKQKSTSEIPPTFSHPNEVRNSSSRPFPTSIDGHLTDIRHRAGRILPLFLPGPVSCCFFLRAHSVRRRRPFHGHKRRRMANYIKEQTR